MLALGATARPQPLVLLVQEMIPFMEVPGSSVPLRMARRHPTLVMAVVVAAAGAVARQTEDHLTGVVAAAVTLLALAEYRFMAALVVLAAILAATERSPVVVAVLERLVLVALALPVR